MNIIFDIEDIEQMLDWLDEDVAKTIVFQNTENLFHQCSYRSYEQQIMYYVYCFSEVSTWRRHTGQAVSKAESNVNNSK